MARTRECRRAPIAAMAARSKRLVRRRQLCNMFTGMTASIDPEDPTILRFEMYYSPIFPLEYIIMTFNLRAQI